MKEAFSSDIKTLISHETIIFLDTYPSVLRFFTKPQLEIIEHIEKDLITEKITKKSYLLKPCNFFVHLLSNIKGLVQIFIWAAIFVYVFGLGFLFELVNDYSVGEISIYISFIFLIVTFTNILILKSIDYIIKRKIAILKNKPFNTELYIIEFSSLFEIYDRLHVMELLRQNKDNVFGLVVLKYILSSIDNDTIKHTDIIFDSSKLLKESMKQA